jgi:hypothetical protein
MLARYKVANESSTGSVHKCPSCGVSVVKSTYNKIFCSNGRTKGKSNCKDWFWNIVDPNKRCRLTPHFYNVVLEKYATDRGYPNYETMQMDSGMEDGSWDAHGGVQLEICNVCKLRSDYCECGIGADSF